MIVKVIFYHLALHQLPTHCFINETKGLGSLKPTCKHFQHHSHVSCMLFKPTFQPCYVCFICIKKMSLVKYPHTQPLPWCLAITCETKRPNLKFPITKSFKHVERCTTNVDLSLCMMFPLHWHVFSHINISLLQ